MPTNLTATDLRELLDSTLDDPALVLEEGRFRVVGGQELTDENRAFLVVTREDLRKQLPQDRDHDESDLELQAGVLGSTVANLGG
ncbi:hypothetical protein NXT08_02110 [Rhodococcus pyridinivorans]|uniref:Uncharacterized protein n=3 Tax=Rhodococcus TaxID=1827 RepID=V9XCZ7_9NOCA|nr:MULTISPECIES: hypothetical protein [Rhodococcus]AHD19855.1 hypothetical protein Y013_03745 [Rhodococcus pyridinivorans SB3094]AOD23182.1 hypothetical protein IM25_17600 [Rhodococcus sp. p52]APE09215.1 hypothetical protein BO226_08300 [Rhodococcus sp. 2G]AWZ25205.1 hypothetical protein CEJ39_14395 [Rhodococcus pyridinivorans]MCB8908524.1 hypothetical protein [Rhodococcus rhodochrous]